MFGVRKFNAFLQPCVPQFQCMFISVRCHPQCNSVPLPHLALSWILSKVENLSSSNLQDEAPDCFSVLLGPSLIINLALSIAIPAAPVSLNLDLPWDQTGPYRTYVNHLCSPFLRFWDFILFLHSLTDWLINWHLRRPREAMTYIFYSRHTSSSYHTISPRDNLDANQLHVNQT